MEAEAGTNSMRRGVAIAIILLGGVALWRLGMSGVRGAQGWNAMSKVLAEEQKENAATNDRRLAGAHRFEDGGWIYVHLEGTARPHKEK